MSSSPVARNGRSASRGTYASRSRSRTYDDSPRKRSKRSNSRERRRSRSPRSRRSRSPGYRGRPPPRYSRYNDGRDNPVPNRCLGVFGMSLHTTERDLKKIFGEYGEIDTVQIVYDRISRRSRGFGFVYFMTTKDSTRAKDHLKDAVIDGMKVRVDYSVTKGGGPGGPRGRSRSRERRRSHSRSRSRSRS